MVKYRIDYFVIHYFEYILILFFLAFILYHKYSNSSNRRRYALLAVLAVSIALCINYYNINNRHFPDPHLNKIITSRYKFQFAKDSKLTKNDPRLERIINLDLRSK